MIIKKFKDQQTSLSNRRKDESSPAWLHAEVSEFYDTHDFETKEIAILPIQIKILAHCETAKHPKLRNIRMLKKRDGISLSQLHVHKEMKVKESDHRLLKD
ncbi:hypothetical protein NPIL_405001 [Nephila pilipes]|uniref:Uncharacterized protein n=1 Tax=Nephila pilipes TaxID=299642 RepID=A0A8X6P3L5_NEPPI|nr:hypothetical protein NPIL_405001 [Nephila pilipes]